MSTRVLVHESGHANVAHALGLAVHSVSVHDRGGICYHTEPVDWRKQVLCDLGGVEGERVIFGEAIPHPSFEDIRNAERRIVENGGNLRTTFKALRDEAHAICWRHRDQIAELAERLAERGKLNQFDLARLSWDSSSSLHTFQSLYARPAANDWRALKAMVKAEGTPDTSRQVLRGVIVAEAGPFIDGRGEFNVEGLREIARLINASDEGLRCRWDHPGPFGEQLGAFVGRVKSAKVGVVTRGTITNHVVRGDLHFSPAAKFSPLGDLQSYILAAAESDDAKAIGMSLVVRPMEVEQGRGRPPLWFPVELAACDIVAKGAATGSLLAAS